MGHQMSESFHKFEDKVGAAANEAAQALKTAEQEGAERYAAVSAKVRQHWDTAKADLGKLGQTVIDQSQVAAKATDNFVKDRPWTTVGIAAGIGLLVGWLIARD